MNRKFIVLLVTFGLSNLALAGIKVTSLDMKSHGANETLKIGLEGHSKELPDVKVNGRTIEIIVPKADAFKEISKNFQGTTVTAVTANGSAVIKATMPYEVSQDKVNLNLKNKDIEVVFPRGKVQQVNTPAPSVVAQKIEKKAEPSINKEELNEDYLNKLMKESTAASVQEKAPHEEIKKDEVAVKMAAPAKEETPAVKKKAADSFSFAGYAAKFTVFLALVLGMFYGVVQLLKKGVFNRGKLGFLNNSQMIEVLSTTYVAPKRSIMMVKAHNQVFLISNSESGLNLLSEMKDTAGLFKEGEKFVTGSNFDTSIGQAEEVDLESSIKLKGDIMESEPLPEEKAISKIPGAKDIVKFSDELKKKAKKLKPIEFN